MHFYYNFWVDFCFSHRSTVCTGGLCYPWVQCLPARPTSKPNWSIVFGENWKSPLNDARLHTEGAPSGQGCGWTQLQSGSKGEHPQSSLSVGVLRMELGVLRSSCTWSTYPWLWIQTWKLLSFAAPSLENKINVPALDAVVTPDDVRYFTNETDDIANLEASVLENPYNVQLWIKLAYKYLNQNEW